MKFIRGVDYSNIYTNKDILDRDLLFSAYKKLRHYRAGKYETGLYKGMVCYDVTFPKHLFGEQNNEDIDSVWRKSIFIQDGDIIETMDNGKSNYIKTEILILENDRPHLRDVDMKNKYIANNYEYLKNTPY